MHVTVAEELLNIPDKQTQFKLTELIKDSHLSSRVVRKMVKRMKTKPNNDYFCHSPSKSDTAIIHRSFDRAIIALRISIEKLIEIHFSFSR